MNPYLGVKAQMINMHMTDTRPRDDIIDSVQLQSTSSIMAQL